MLAALANGVKGGKWYSLIDKVVRLQTLEIAWHKVAANKGGAGVDGQSVERFGQKSEQYLRELSEALESGSYRPQPVKRVEIPKGGGKSRPLGIPVVKDRIVQTALKMVIEPIFEQEFECEPDVAGLVWLFQACDPRYIQDARRIHSSSAPSDTAQTTEATGNGPQPGGPCPLAECLLRWARAFHHG
jgi:hypothetical protein